MLKIDIKNIHIGSLIHQKVKDDKIDIIRIRKFLKYSDNEIIEMYKSESLDTAVLIRWSKLLEYDFFRIYSQHLILYAPQSSMDYNLIQKEKKLGLPQFKKNIYTKDLINFILELIDTKKKTKAQIIKEYKIPKTTLYKWIEKYRR